MPARVRQLRQNGWRDLRLPMGSSTRNINRGDANTATIARPTPCSNVLPGWLYISSAIAVSRNMVRSSTGRRKALLDETAQHFSRILAAFVGRFAAHPL